jgi:hypothetical protein
MHELAKRGYRFRRPDSSQRGGGTPAMMEKCPADCAGRYEYRTFNTKNAAQISTDLNALGSDGFRVLPSMLDSRLQLLERDTREKRTFSYRIHQLADAASLQQALNGAEQEGYAPLGFVYHGGWISGHGFLVLEKEIKASSSPQPPPPSQ